MEELNLNTFRSPENREAVAHYVKMVTTLLHMENIEEKLSNSGVNLDKVMKTQYKIIEMFSSRLREKIMVLTQNHDPKEIIMYLNGQIRNEAITELRERGWSEYSIKRALEELRSRNYFGEVLFKDGA